eukprot:TRINITY_DN7931_c0_g1::TRINITY_DN7931_c0_g1_i1::g.15623::m.15623 TRINITY_DN7931_c0_g1::TRINITY_DN7931_c0_g1_i1::g.15623  ORF type:complete len:1244 (+),score=360.81,sp/Q8T2I8/SEPA_DICDI/43.59/3e-144,sp/Q8T2I8/SEPA_DICDI/59.02/3e-107,Pkinase/PF00069.20/5.7e-71,Pkinase_Tyr/PF07714.12/5.6e-49,Kinase-like/PF14531.1/0.0032,Arm/PF00514.18/1.4e+03,Arm/PF00514.18/1.5e+02,Arm/PF00514.18/1.2e+04,Arm/PF00514.18/3.4,Arm/PF00514.18/7.6e+03,Ric8/PF10165.4/40,Ric8/PF10165.4/0.088,BUD22/PF09073.5/0.043,DUF3385/P
MGVPGAKSDPKKLGNYQIGEIVGKGGFGTVYKGINLSTGEFVAIKQVSLQNIPKEELSSIMMEIDLLKRLHHENIVEYVGSIKSNQHLNIILEYVENGSLAQIIKKFGAFPETLVGIYIAQVLKGLEYLHTEGVIHRDIKGANILSTKRGLVKLADFGVATKLADAEESNEVVGTPYWMAPEIIEMTGTGTASDIWSVGCLVIELLTGAPPYYDFAPMPALFRIVNDDHPPLPDSISSALEDFLLQCFKKDQHLRPDATKLLKHPWVKAITKSVDSLVEKGVDIPDISADVASGAAAADSEDGFTRTINFHRAVTKKIMTAVRPAASFSTRDLPKAEIGPMGESGVGVEALAKELDGEVSQGTAFGRRQDDESGQNTIRRTSITEPVDEDKSDSSRASQDHAHTHAHGHPHGAAPPASAATAPPPEEKKARKSSLSLTRKPSLKGIDKYRDRDEDDDFNDLDMEASNVQEKIKAKSSAAKPMLISPDDIRLLDAQRTAAAAGVAAGATGAGQGGAAGAGAMGMAAAGGGVEVRLARYAERDDEDYDDLLEAPDEFDRLSDDDLASGMSNQREGRMTDFSSLGAPAGRTGAGTGTGTGASGFGTASSGMGLGMGMGMGTGRPMSTAGSMSLDFAAKLKDRLKRDNGGKDELDDDDDPFADMMAYEEIDFERAAKQEAEREKRDSAIVLGHIANLDPSKSESEILDACDKLVRIFRDHPTVKSHLTTHHGVIPIMDMLHVRNPKVTHAILQVVNQIIEENREFQENLCLVGIIPIIMTFTERDHPKPTRLQAARFIKQMCCTSTLTLQMFIACRGLPVLVNLLERDYVQHRDLVWTAIDCIIRVFKLQSPTPKNDFCRLFVKNGLLDELVVTLQNCNTDSARDTAQRYTTQVADLFLLFAHADTVVKLHVAKPQVLEGIFRALDDLAPANQLKIVKCIKHLSMDPNTLEPLQRARAIPKLVQYLTFADRPYATDINNQVLNALFNLCKVNKTRQEQAAVAGIVPRLQHFISTDSPLKQFALEIFCQLPHASRRCRAELWRHDGLRSYLELFSHEFWQVQAVDSLAVWLSNREEMKRVEEVLVRPENVQKFVELIRTAKMNSLKNLLEPLLKIVQLSSRTNKALGDSAFVSCLLERLRNDNADANIRLNLLKILRSLYERHERPKQLITQHRLIEVMMRLQKADKVLIQQIANNLLIAFTANDVI